MFCCKGRLSSEAEFQQRGNNKKAARTKPESVLFSKSREMVNVKGCRQRCKIKVAATFLGLLPTIVASLFDPVLFATRLRIQCSSVVELSILERQVYGARLCSQQPRPPKRPCQLVYAVDSLVFLISDRRNGCVIKYVFYLTFIS